MAMAITKLVRNAKEKSFGSSLSRKACGEPQSAKLTVRGRASRSRRKSDAASIKAISDYLPANKGTVITKSQSVDNQTSTLFLFA